MDSAKKMRGSCENIPYGAASVKELLKDRWSEDQPCTEREGAMHEPIIADLLIEPADTREEAAVSLLERRN